jgi:hypothetical protein
VVLSGGATLGMSGLIGGGAAALQYKKGRKFGKPLSKSQIAEVTA